MKLFEPIAIRGLTLKNRILMAPMNLGLGLRGRRARAFFAERAQGGVAAIITQGTPPDVFCSDEAWGQPGAAQTFAETSRLLAEEVHLSGGTIGIQLACGARYPVVIAQPDTGGEAVAPSPSDGKRALSQTEIQDIIAKFAGAAAAVKKAGFDFVELHGAHGNLVCQFFSPIDNKRDDTYGGSLRNRMRLGLELTAAVRQAVEDFPISFRFPAQESLPGGITIPEAQTYAQELERAGVDLLNVSIGRGPSGRSLGGPGPKIPYGTYVPLAAAIKEKVRIPVAAVGRINTPEVAEAALAEGKADLVAIGRQLIADPFWPQKARERQPYLLCDSCGVHCRNVQTRPNLPSDAPLCHQNPRAGKEAEIPRSGG